MNGKVYFVDVDNEGRVKIPAELRRRLGIGPGSQIALVVLNQSVYLHPVCPNELVSEGSLPASF